MGHNRFHCNPGIRFNVPQQESISAASAASFFLRVEIALPPANADPTQNALGSLQ